MHSRKVYEFTVKMYKFIPAHVGYPVRVAFGIGSKSYFVLPKVSCNEKGT